MTDTQILTNHCSEQRTTSDKEMLSQLSSGREAGYTLNRSPVHHRATQRATHTLTTRLNLDSPINLACMFLGSGWKQEYPERTHVYTGENMQTPHRKDPAGI